ncbi:Pentatricopeptide repeat protein [Cordyceps fumosorosea ARSEF 2679]|uniref:Pentatricopeptide repeat protein n=1 Tax=Cordyceps fumosorosea (strain ARSEF 2679) TaxID=1081104 RepID=A0A167VUH8_CORFA|nr:Pentatricopeptide repeat protein [Cordyceps fumosorosea ARSEF 2679]OAA62991.1 Pentatricopeptide repeat protein [Cordyceps fumosorosea ARSEF 2679]
MYAGVAALFRSRAVRLGVPRISAAASSPTNLGRQALSFARRRPLHLSSSPTPSTTTSTDPTDTTQPTTIVKPKLSHTNLARNSEIRYAYRDKTPEIEAAVEEMLGTAYIPPARRYPMAESTALSLQRARRVARIRVGEEMLARKGGKVRRRDAADTLGLLKNMTQSRGRKPAMHAMRIVLPREWELDVSSGKSVDFVEARTGLAARLRMTSDRENATAVVLRGQGPVLAKAADEIIAVCRDVEIFKLGEVTSFDYAAQRLWPVIEDAEDGGAVVPPGQLENIWLHKEQQYWIDSAYEKTPRPEEWTKPSFDMFIKSLVYGRLKPGLPRPVYTHGTHTDKIRVRMIMEVFEDPSARRFITTPILKMALQFMAAHGGHRASAERLLSQAERWGVPLDTDAFNILLDCYVRKHDARFFHKVLVKMRERCFYPDARTWLHFLRLVQRDDVRLQVEAAMFDLGLFDDPGTRRSVGVVTAGTLAHQAFRAGETLLAFLDKQAARFGPSWLADEDGAAANAVLTEFFLFHPSAAASRRYHDYRVLVDRLVSERGGSRGAASVLPASTLNLILEHCAQPHARDWDTALWALDRASPATNPRDDSAVGERAAVATAYRHLVDLCVGTRSPAALAAVVFYAVNERALSVRAARTAVTAALLGKAGAGPGGSVDHHHAWWRAHSPQLLSRDMAATLRKNPVESKAHAVRAIEVAIRDATAGYVPAERLVDVLRAAQALDQQQDAAAASNEGDAVGERPALTIALLSVEDSGDSEPSPRTEVCLDSAFDVRRMVLYNQHATPPWRKRSGGETAASASSSKAGASPSSSTHTETVQRADEEAEKASAAEQGGEKSSGHHPLVQYLNSLH